MEARGAASEAATANNWTAVFTLLEKVGYTSADGREMSKYLLRVMGGEREKYLRANPEAMRRTSLVIMSTVSVVGKSSAHVKLRVMMVISSLSASGSIAMPNREDCPATFLAINPSNKSVNPAMAKRTMAGA